MKTLIIGFGSIGKKHFLALKALKIQVDVLSLSYEKTEYENLKFKLYKHLDEVPLNEYELFIIANITTSHFSTLKSLDKRLKNKTILVEKPLFEKDYKFKSLKNTIYVAYLLRFNPLVKALKAFLKKDKKPYFASFECDSYLPNWRQGDYTKHYSAKKALGGGVSLDLSHELDLALWFFNKAKLEFSSIKKLSELEITSDDLAFFALKDEKSRVYVRLNYFSKFNERKIIFHTENKSYKADLVKNELVIFKKNGSFIAYQYEANTIDTLMNLHNALRKKDKNLCTLKEGQRVMKLITKAKK